MYCRVSMMILSPERRGDDRSMKGNRHEEIKTRRAVENFKFQSRVCGGGRIRDTRIELNLS